MGKLIVVILEGASLELVTKWCKKGHLPNIDASIKSGTSGKFNSLSVPYEPSALVSSFTGDTPGVHGCYSYWHVKQDDYEEPPKIFQSQDLATPLFWNWESLKNRRFNVVNLFGTHPPRALNGNLISYPLVPSVNSSYPRKLLYELSRQGMSYGHDVSALYEGSAKEEFFQLLMRLEDSRMQVCDHLLKNEADISIFNLTLLDRVSHFWWSEVENLTQPEDETILFRAYQKIDSFLGQMVDRMSKDDHLIYFSEIGFGQLKKFVSVNDILNRSGFLKYTNGVIDSTNTIAMEAVQGSHGINLNPRSKYNYGRIDEKGKQNLLEEIIDCLKSAVNPETNRPYFGDVLRGTAMYKGGRSDMAPDLILQVEDETYLPLGHPYWAMKVHRHLQTGWHRRRSIWGGIGPSFKAGLVRDINCYDIIPLMLNSLNITLSTKSNYVESSKQV